MFTFRYFVKNNHLQFYFHENENLIHQTGRVVYDLHSPKGLDTHIGEWANANFKPCWLFVIRAANNCRSSDIVDHS